MRLLLVDDDQALTGLLQPYLENEGLSVTLAHDGQQGLRLALEGDFDLILLDVMLPLLDGFEVLKKLRQQRLTPVLMLTAKGDDFDRIVGLELGADDYLPKPFNHRELLARIKAICRRSQYSRQQALPILHIHGLHLDAGARTVHYRQQPVSLTGTEFALLAELMQQAGQVISKEQLSRTVLGRRLLPFDRSIDMHLSNIRKKLAAIDEQGPTLIKTARGAGYVFTREAGQ